MPLTVIGVNHKHAPVAVRERVAFRPEQLPQALEALRGCAGVTEAAILSTCNRTEIYCHTEGGARERVVDWLVMQPGVGDTDLRPYLYCHDQPETVRHLLRVASGLDSMVLGEPQILGQLKEAYQAAVDHGSIGRLLNRLFQHCFHVAKKVRTDTAIGSSPVSIAFAAVRLAQQIHGDLAGTTAMLIGAGDMIELAANHLYANRLRHLLVANRSLERAQTIASRFGGYALPLQDLPAHLADADIVISSTASPTPILMAETVALALQVRRRKPMFLVDIAVPRDIDPAVSELEDVYLYTIDDLQAVIEENLRSREAAAAQAEQMIDTAAQQFLEWMQQGDAVDMLRTLRSHAEAARDEVLQRALKQLECGTPPQEALQFLANTLTNKLIHTPTVRIKAAATEGREDIIATAADLFELKPGG
ncbi:MAG: glutamyl-tRNA reductase [Gammaproteobacteria bacterium]